MGANAAADEHRELITRLDAIKAQLDRMEARQKHDDETTAAPPVGGFMEAIKAQLDRIERCQQGIPSGVELQPQVQTQTLPPSGTVPIVTSS